MDEQMKKNRFWQDRMQILFIAYEKGKDIDTASHMHAEAKHWKDWERECDEWNALCIRYTQSKDKGLSEIFK